MIHRTSLLVVAKARYSASVEDLEMVSCFLVFHDIRDSPRKTQKPVTDFHVSAYAAQSTSENALNLMEKDARKKIP